MATNQNTSKKNESGSTTAFKSVESSEKVEGMTAGLFWTDNNGNTTYSDLEHIQIVRNQDGTFELGIRTISGMVLDFSLALKKGPKFMPLP